MKKSDRVFYRVRGLRSGLISISERSDAVLIAQGDISFQAGKKEGHYRGCQADSDAAQ